MVAPVVHIRSVGEPPEGNEEIVVYIDATIEVEIGPHHPNHRPAFGVYRYRAANYRFLAAETTLPETVTKNDDALRCGVLILWSERTADQRTNTERLKEARTNPAADNSFWFTVAGEHKTCRHSHSDVFKDGLSFSPIKIVRIRDGRFGN